MIFTNNQGLQSLQKMKSISRLQVALYGFHQSSEQKQILSSLPISKELFQPERQLFFFFFFLFYCT